MTTLGTPFSSSATKVLLCGSGELGKEVAIEFQRLGCEVIALDRYDHAPAMQVADRSYTLSMLDGAALAEIIKAEKPDYIIPEIEAIVENAMQLEDDDIGSGLVGLSMSSALHETQYSRLFRS